MAKHIKFKVPLYHSVIWVTSDADEARRLGAVKLGMVVPEEKFYPHVNGLTIREGGDAVVWLPKGCSQRTLVHETFHVMTGICHAKGVEIDTCNDEPSAYLIGFLADEITFAYNKLNGVE